MANSLFDQTMSTARARTPDPRADEWIRRAGTYGQNRAAQKHKERKTSWGGQPQAHPHLAHPQPVRSGGFGSKPRASAPTSRQKTPPYYTGEALGQYQVPTGTLPYAYGPSSSAIRDNGRLVRGWKTAAVKMVLKDLGFIILEAVLAAVGHAIYTFFAGHRRFHPGPGVN